MKQPENENFVIEVNFLPLVNQQFNFEVFRRQSHSSDERREDEKVYRYSLPCGHESDLRSEYWISFKPRDGYVLYICSQESNRQLSLRYLNHTLASSVKEHLPPNDYDVSGVDFRHGIDVIVRHHPQGSERIWIESCYLAPAQMFGFLIDFHFHKNPNVAFDRTIQKLSLSLDQYGQSNKDFYSNKYDKVITFLHNNRAAVFPKTTCDGILEIEPEFEKINASILSARRYIFGENREHVNTFTGVNKFGPLRPVEKPVRFAAIYSAGDRQLLRDLAAALVGKASDIAFRGMHEVFKVQVGATVVCEATHLRPADISSIADRLKTEQKNDPNSVLMPLVVISKKDPELYAAIKLQLLEAGFPVQVVSTELLRNRIAFKWSVANIALAAFAKSGGEPWRVVPTTNRCVIIGLGQAHDHAEDGRIKRYFSYLVCTDTSGEYRRTDVLGSSHNEESYLEQFGERITRAIRQEMAAGYTRCVLHVPFKIRRNELRAIESALMSLRSEADNTNIQFVVLRVNDESKYFGFAGTNSLIPYESTFAKVSNSPSTYLVWFDGLQFGNPVVHKRPSGPVQIEFYWPQRELKEAEERLLLQDMLNLAGCNWRGFNAKHLPISIFYSQLIAKHLRQFGTSSVRLDTLTLPWFL